MAGGSILWSVSLYLSTLLLDINCFNLDTKVPIVKVGVADSYFGFSVAQHPKTNLGTNNVEHVFLVGAPLGNISHPAADPTLRRLSRPGVIYSCPLTSNTGDCDELQVDNEPPISKEDKNGQWMGVSLASQRTSDGKVVACAHRFTEVGPSSRWGKGQCRIMDNSLDYDEAVMPCAYKSTQRGHNEYGFCQVGTASDISQDGDLLVGSPGPYTNRGAMFKYSLIDSLDADKQMYSSPVADLLEDEVGPSPATRFYSYLGYSAKIGNLLGEKTYAGGAPRSSETGQVLLFKHGAKGSAHLDITPDHYLTGEQFGSGFGYSLEIIDLNKDGLDDLVVGAPFYSESGVGGAVYIYMNSPGGITSETEPLRLKSRDIPAAECKELDCENGRFGFSIANIGDLDRDGYDDLAVGAPFEGDGCVYIFRGSQKGIEKKASQRIAASELLSARPLQSFGYSLSGGLDMDGNGYPDVVVGAYDSSKSLLLRSRPVIQVLAMVEVRPEPRINPNVIQCKSDGHRNNCFDLNICFGFTAEPKERFSGKLDIVYKLEAELFTGKKISRVFFKGADEPNNHEIERSIKLPEQITGEYGCREHKVYLIKNNKDFLNPIAIRLTYWLPAKAPPTMSPGDPLPDINNYPVLNEATSSEIISPGFEWPRSKARCEKSQQPCVMIVPFEKNCGADDLCHSNLRVAGDFPHLDKDADGFRLFKVGQVKELHLSVMVENRGEDAHETSLTVSLPADEVSYVGVETSQQQKRQVSCVPNNEGQVICGIGNPMVRNQRSEFTIKLSPKFLSAAIRKLNFGLRVNTTSIESDTIDDTVFIDVVVVVETDILVRGWSQPNELFFGGVVRGESAVRTENDIGGEVRHSYEVKNTGTGKVASSTLRIQWPYEVYNGEFNQGKHLLYLMEDPVVDGPAKCSIKDRDKYVNPINIQLDRMLSLKFRQRLSANAVLDRNLLIPVNSSASISNKRVKRENIIAPEKLTDEVGKSLTVVTMDCGKGSARCFDIMCTIGNLNPEMSVVISMRSRLWNSTFLEDYRNVDEVRIYSTGTVSIDPALNVKQTDTSNDIARALTKAIPDIEVKPQEGVPLWVIILAAIGGVLLLILLILLLWKCGFFKRNVPDDMRQHKAKKEKANAYLDDGYN